MLTIEPVEPSDGGPFPVLPGWVYLRCVDDDRDCGMLALEPWGDGVWELHAAITVRGRASRFARLAAEHMLAGGARKVVAFPPVENTAAFRAAIGAGMRYLKQIGGYHLMEYRHG